VLSRVAALELQLALAILREQARAASEDGLPVLDHRGLHLAALASNPLTIGELAGATGLTTGAATGLVDRLEAAGHIRRCRDGGDRRKIRLEPLGRPGTLERAVRSGVDSAGSGFPAAELAVIERYLLAWLDRLDERHGRDGDAARAGHDRGRPES
jgi:DNA-binding MarR family transcriptional regulator